MYLILTSTAIVGEKTDVGTLLDLHAFSEYENIVYMRKYYEGKKLIFIFLWIYIFSALPPTPEYEKVGFEIQFVRTCPLLASEQLDTFIHIQYPTVY
jgi:hypothetical protein